MEITKDKITEIFCIIDEFCQEYDKEIARMSICEPDGRKHRNRKWTMSRSEIMTILICFHFNTFRNFKHYYLFYVKMHLCDLFPKQLSYNRFVELESRVSVGMIDNINPQGCIQTGYRKDAGMRPSYTFVPRN